MFIKENIRVRQEILLREAEQKEKTIIEGHSIDR